MYPVTEKYSNIRPSEVNYIKKKINSKVYRNHEFKTQKSKMHLSLEPEFQRVISYRMVPFLNFVFSPNALASVVYFNQHLGAAHSKCWSKKLFSANFVLKKSNKFAAKFCKKHVFWE